MGVNPPPEGEEPEPQKARRLNRMGDIRGALADVARMLETKRMEPERGRALINCLDTLGKYIKERDLETMAERIRDIQARKAEQAEAATSPPALAVVPRGLSCGARGPDGRVCTRELAHILDHADGAFGWSPRDVPAAV